MLILKLEEVGVLQCEILVSSQLEADLKVHLGHQDYRLPKPNFKVFFGNQKETKTRKVRAHCH